MGTHEPRSHLDVDLDNLFDEENGVISAKAYCDPGIYALELERVFNRCWLFICHEQHILRPGDFFATYMAEDPVIAVRQNDGSVRVFLNQCRHRGMKVCRTDCGNAKAFNCTYHGWAYNISGDLLSVPDEENACGPGFEKARWGLRQTPLVEEYKGLIFATWNESAPNLREYLGDVAGYLDRFIDRAGGTKPVGGMFKWVVPCNWKFAAEQFASDMVHARTSHASIFIASGSRNVTTFPSGQFSERRSGHGTGFFLAPEGELVPVSSTGLNVQGFDPMPRLRQRAAHNPWSTRMVVQHLTVFPNFSIISNSDSMRVWHPRGPNEIEVWAFTVIEADATKEEFEQHRLQSLRTFSPAGTFEQEDGENWVEIQRVLKGYQAKQSQLNMQMGLGKQWATAPIVPGSTPHANIEDAARNMYARWLTLLKDADGASASKEYYRHAAE
jgi:phenylpropionate dioxygenase-like ring-hydroxylating dioxygenase large terminal subunit